MSMSEVLLNEPQLRCLAMAEGVTAKFLRLHKKVADNETRMLEINRDAIQQMEGIIARLKKTAAPLKKTAHGSDEAKAAEAQVLLDRIQEQIEKTIASIERMRTESAAPSALEVNSIATLEPFDAENLPDDLRENYIVWLSGYVRSHNNYYVIELFTLFVDKGITPPKWVMDIIYKGFYAHLKDIDTNPDKLAQQLGLKGNASGATNPWHDRVRRVNRSPAMVDMVKLIHYFGLSQLRAAKAVKIKFDLKESANRLKNYYSEYFGSVRDIAAEPGRLPPMNEYERTKFVSSFPVAARKLFKKK